MNLFKLFAVVFLLLVSLTNQAQKFDPPLFVFEDGLWNAESESPEYWAGLVKEAGFDGMELIGVKRLDEMIPALQMHNLKLYALYIEINIDNDQPYDPRVKEYIWQMKNTGLHLWVHVHSTRYKPSDPAGDETCIPIIRELADYAESYGVKIAFYPHTDFWVEKSDDGVRLAEKVNKSNVGTVFNLCHFLKKDERDKLEEKLKKAMPHLFLVSINGADDGDTGSMGWDRLIQPLGSGNYDVLHVLEILKEHGYRNPVGLQCYDIKGKPEVFLRQSMQTWEKYINQLNQ